MVMGSSNWPLPSQSYRVRLLLYLAEGIGIGAFLTLLLVEFFSIFLDIETGAFDFTITATDAVFFGFVLFYPPKSSRHQSNPAIISKRLTRTSGLADSTKMEMGWGYCFSHRWSVIRGSSVSMGMVGGFLLV